MENRKKIKEFGNTRYALITPARNEADFIEQTINAMLGQSCRPVVWVIVSDGSTDGTDEIVRSYQDKHDWLMLLRMPERKERHFGGKVMAFNKGYDRIKDRKYEVIGNLDADISFDADYFEFLLKKFNADETLGVCGTPFMEDGTQYDYRFSRREHVSGACQLFRRECFEQIGGYVPIKEGAIDLCAVVTARMKGWKTETFTDKYCIHHRKMGTAKSGIIAASFKSGVGDFRMGVHPLWQTLRSFYQMTRKPLLVQGIAILAGYVWGAMRGASKPVSDEFVAFRRKEQLVWLTGYLKRPFNKAFSKIFSKSLE
jgi:poly-beta-1,6-N-acetyl-D-glucosamine synthase